MNGRESSYRPIFSGISKNDPLPPHGRISTLGNTTRTDSPNVVLLLDVLNENPAETEVIIANNGRFEGGQWQPFQNEIAWVLDEVQLNRQSAQTPSLATVFIKFRDQAQNESNTYTLTFVVEPPNSLGAISGTVVLEGNFDPSGIPILILDDSTAPSAITDETGQFLLEGLPSGTYQLLIEHPGYAGQTIEAEVLPDTIVNVGIIKLLESEALYNAHLPMVTHMLRVLHHKSAS